MNLSSGSFGDGIVTNEHASISFTGTSANSSHNVKRVELYKSSGCSSHGDDRMKRKGKRPGKRVLNQQERRIHWVMDFGA